MNGHRRRHVIIQAARRLVQATAVAFIVALALLGLYHHYYASRAVDEIASIGGLRGTALAFIDDNVRELGDPETIIENNHGNLWSMRIGGIDLSDPLAFLEASAAGRTVHVPLLLSILAPVAVTLLLGRVFCSWICPGYVLFELGGKLRKGIERAGMEPVTVAFAHGNKYALLAVGILLAALTGLPVFSMIYPPAVLSRTAHALIFGTGVVGMLTILGLVVAFEVFVSPRWWCRSMCPGGALYGLLGARRLLRVRVVQGACTNCGLCHPACEEGLNVLKQSTGIECDNCGLCIRRCPDRALEYSFVRGGARPAPSSHGRASPAAPS